MRSFCCLAIAFSFSCAPSAAVPLQPVSVQLEESTESAPSTQPTAAERAVDGAPGQAELTELMEQLIDMAQAGDMVGLAALFHPALQTSVERELTRATDEKIADVVTCIQRALEDAEIYEGEVRFAIRQLGGRNVQLRIAGAPTSTVGVEHEGEWYLVDTGC